MTSTRPSHYAEMQAHTRANKEAKEAEQLTLRDRMAMAALTGLLASGLEEHWDSTEQQWGDWRDDVDGRWAVYCYQMADAMLSARKAPKEK